MSHGTMEDLLLIKGNNSLWSEKDRQDILETALDHYMTKHRKLQVDDCGPLPDVMSSNPTQPEPLPDTISESESDCDSESDLDLDFPEVDYACSGSDGVSSDHELQDGID